MVGRPRRAEESLGRLRIAMLAQHRVDQVSVPVDRSVKVAPPAADLQIGFVNIPADAGGATGPMTPFAQRVAHDGQQVHLPVADSLVAYLDPAQRHNLARIPQRQPVAQPTEHHEGDDVAWQAAPVQHSAAALIELPPAIAAPLASCRELPALSHRRGATVNAIHSRASLPLGLRVRRDHAEGIIDLLRKLSKT